MSVTVYYPHPKDGEFFDMDYYIKTHMPIAEANWTPLGLLDWKVLHFDSDAPYHVIAVLNWESEDRAKLALKDKVAKTVLDDVANFTNVKPIISPGKIAGTSENKEKK